MLRRFKAGAFCPICAGSHDQVEELDEMRGIERSSHDCGKGRAAIVTECAQNPRDDLAQYVPACGDRRATPLPIATTMERLHGLELPALEGPLGGGLLSCSTRQAIHFLAGENAEVTCKPFGFPPASISFSLRSIPAVSSSSPRSS